jgi:hypothetical protein
VRVVGGYFAFVNIYVLAWKMEPTQAIPQPIYYGAGNIVIVKHSIDTHHDNDDE